MLVSEIVMGLVRLKNAYPRSMNADKIQTIAVAISKYDPSKQQLSDILDALVADFRFSPTREDAVQVCTNVIGMAPKQVHEQAAKLLIEKKQIERSGYVCQLCRDLGMVIAEHKINKASYHFGCTCSTGLRNYPSHPKWAQGREDDYTRA